MRDLFKIFSIGIALCFTPLVFAEDYKVLVIPDNIVTDNISVDSYIYNASSEFFADDIITKLNSTDFINAPTVSETRDLYKKDPSSILTARNLTNKFRTNYNIDYVSLNKLAQKADSKYVLLITSYLDHENYVLRRTLWDFLNVPGATVIDPAYKISTYAVLIDTEKNKKLWSDTYYKTISTCENRIITRGASPQTEQLQKIKDYSKYISPQIAQNVQLNVLPSDVLAEESSKIDYDLGDIDNVFTKKYRHIGKESNKIYNQKKAEVKEFAEETKEKYKELKENWETKKLERLEKQKEMESKLEVKATPIYEESTDSLEIIENNTDNIKDISNKTTSKYENIKNTVFKKNSNDILYPELIQIEIKKKKKKNNLLGDYDSERPDLRSYH